MVEQCMAVREGPYKGAYFYPNPAAMEGDPVRIQRHSVKALTFFPLRFVVPQEETPQQILANLQKGLGGTKLRTEPATLLKLAKATGRPNENPAYVKERLGWFSSVLGGVKDMGVLKGFAFLTWWNRHFIRAEQMWAREVFQSKEVRDLIAAQNNEPGAKADALKTSAHTIMALTSNDAVGQMLMGVTMMQEIRHSNEIFPPMLSALYCLNMVDKLGGCKGKNGAEAKKWLQAFNFFKKIANQRASRNASGASVNVMNDPGSSMTSWAILCAGGKMPNHPTLVHYLLQTRYGEIVKKYPDCFVTCKSGTEYVSRLGKCVQQCPDGKERMYYKGNNWTCCPASWEVTSYGRCKKPKRKLICKGDLIKRGNRCVCPPGKDRVPGTNRCTTREEGCKGDLVKRGGSCKCPPGKNRVPGTNRCTTPLRCTPPKIRRGNRCVCPRPLIDNGAGGCKRKPPVMRPMGMGIFGGDPTKSGGN